MSGRDEAPGAVGDALLEYARRGVIRGFDRRETEDGAEFRFYWLLRRSFVVRFDGAASTLTLEGLLPEGAEHPEVRADVQRLLDDRMEGRVPPHRAVDPERAGVEVHDGDGRDLVLVLHVRNDEHAYGVRKLLNVAHEVWVRLNDAHQRYLWDAYRAPME